MVELAGSERLTVACARWHHKPQESWTVPGHIGEALKAADDDGGLERAAQADRSLGAVEGDRSHGAGLVGTLVQHLVERVEITRELCVALLDGAEQLDDRRGSIGLQRPVLAVAAGEGAGGVAGAGCEDREQVRHAGLGRDRKTTRLNYSHQWATRMP